VLAGIDGEPPLIFNRIAIVCASTTDKKRVLLTQADISNGEIGRRRNRQHRLFRRGALQLGFAGTPMSTSALKRMWPILIVPKCGEWVIERIERGTLQRIDRASIRRRNLSRKGRRFPMTGAGQHPPSGVRCAGGHAVGARCDLKAA
jgi:hypothetical protein